MRVLDILNYEVGCLLLDRGLSFKVGTQIQWDQSDPSAWVPAWLAASNGPVQHDSPFWKVWEVGPPDWACVVLSASAGRLAPPDTIERYVKTGIQELLIFDVDASQNPLRYWQRQAAGELIEQRVLGDRIWSSIWRVYFVACADRTLRIADASGELPPCSPWERDPSGDVLIDESLPERARELFQKSAELAKSLRRAKSDRES